MSSHRRRDLLLVSLLVLGGCADQHEHGDEDRQHYAAGVGGTSPEERLAHCQAIEDPALRGDCLSLLATAVDQLASHTATELCESIASSPWKEECFFLAAEQARSDGAFEQAAKHCLRAGPFLEDCSVHLWQDQLRAALLPGGLESLLEHPEKVIAIHDRWSERLQLGEDFDRRFWDRCFQVALERQPSVDILACERMRPTWQEPCMRAAVQSYRARLQRALGMGGLHDEFCALSADELSTTSVARIRAMPAAPEHPRLTKLLALTQAHRCKGDFVQGPRTGPAPQRP